MEMEREIVSVQARQLDREMILFGDDVRVEADANADWTRSIKTSQMYRVKSMQRWALVYPTYSEEAVREFVGALITTAKGEWLF